MILSLFSAFVLLSIAPLAGTFFKAPEVTFILWIILIGFLAYPLSATVTATLQRDMRFQTLLAIDVTGSLVQCSVALILVFSSFGVYSLAIALAANSITRAIFCFIVVPDYERFRINLRGVPAVLSFSIAATACLILRKANEGAFAIIAGRVIGPTPVGLAERSSNLINLYDKVIAGIYPVVLPVFAAMRRAGRDSVSPLLRGQALLNLMAMCIYGFLIIVAEPAIVFLYGEQWRPAAVLVPPMMLAALIRSAFERLATPVYLAHGRVDINLKIQAVLTSTTIFALVVAIQFGVMPALWTLVATSVLGALGDLFFLPTIVVVKRGELIWTFVNALGVVAPALVVGYGVNEVAEYWALGTFWHLLFVGLIYLVAFALSVLIFSHPLVDELKRLRTDQWRPAA